MSEHSWKADEETIEFKEEEESEMLKEFDIADENSRDEDLVEPISTDTGKRLENLERAINSGLPEMKEELKSFLHRNIDSIGEKFKGLQDDFNEILRTGLTENKSAAPPDNFPSEKIDEIERSLEWQHAFSVKLEKSLREIEKQVFLEFDGKLRQFSERLDSLETRPGVAGESGDVREKTEELEDFLLVAREEIENLKLAVDSDIEEKLKPLNELFKDFSEEWTEKSSLFEWNLMRN